MHKRFHASYLLFGLSLFAPAALIAQPAVTGDWYFAGMTVEYSNEEGSFQRETGITAGKLSITGNYSDGYSYVLNGTPFEEDAELFTSYTADTLYRYDTYDLGLTTIRTMIQLVSPNLAFYKVFDVDYDSDHRIIDLGVDTFILSKTPFSSINLGALSPGVYNFSEKYHEVIGGNDIALPATYESLSGTFELSIGESTVTIIDDVEQILGVTQIAAVDGYSEAFSVLAGASGGLTGDDFLVVQLNETEVAYGYVYASLGEDGFLTFGEAGIGVASAIPEPSTYAAILGGLVLTGTMLRRRRRQFSGSGSEPAASGQPHF